MILSVGLTERSLCLKCYVENMIAEVRKDDVVQSGVMIRNSEVGLGYHEITPFIRRVWCDNGMAADEYASKKRHIGKKETGSGTYELLSDETKQLQDDAFYSEIRDVLKGFLVDRETFQRIVEKMRQAASDEIKKPEQTIKVLSNTYQLSEDESTGVLTNLCNGRDGTGINRWGLINAVTALSDSAKTYDRATDLERLGGKLLNLTQTEWHQLN